jgi:hypothetical protein
MLRRFFFQLFHFEINSYEYETEVVPFRKEHKLHVHENKVISEKGTVLHNEICCGIHKHLVLFEHWRARYAARVMGSRNENRIFVWKPTG